MTTYLAVDHVLFNESDSAAVFTVRVLGDAPQSDISVSYYTQTASAKGGTNYVGVSVDTPLSITIPAGQTQATISIPLLNDGVDDLLKGFVLKLALPADSTAVLTNRQAVALISDSAGTSALPVFRTHDAVVDEASGHALVQYTLDAPTDHDVTVDFTTRGLNALQGEDFAAVSGTITIAAGQTAGTVSIPVYQDGVAEARELFAVNFSNPVGVTIADPVARVTIEAQDGALTAQGLTGVRAIGNIAYEDEGYIDLFVALTAPSAGAVTVNYATGADTARYNVDYFHQTGTLTFAPGEVIKTVRVLLGNQPGDDGTVASRDFTFSLSAFGAFHSVSNAKGVILNRDAPVPSSLLITTMSGETTGGLLYGTVNNDSIVGSSGNDLLDGHEGNDTMVGGAGDDTYVLEQAGDSAVEVTDASGGRDTIITYLGSHTLADGFENLVLASTTDMAATGTGNAADNLIVGNDGGNVLTGLDGNDTLEGGAGNDTLVGGKGDDVYGVDSLGDVVTELAGEGTDTIRAWINYSLTNGSNIENLSLAGRADINATGDANDNVLTGNVGANVLDGGAGNDTLYGGDGNDTLTGGAGNDTMAGGKGDDSYNVEQSGDTLVEAAGGGTDTVYTTVDYTLTAGAEIERAYLTGTATTLTGNEFGNALYGRALSNDSLSGGAGNDTLDGNSGDDTLVGGAGDDVYIVDTAGDQVVEDASPGTDEVRTGLTTYTLGSNVENLVFTGATASTGTGNALDNRLTGTAGNDTLSGGDGNDTLDGAAGTDSLTGGAGNDLYVVDSLADILVEAAGGGSDTVQTGLTYTLATNFENLILTGSSAVDGTGNAADNRLTGNAAANTLTALDGNDTLDGGAGADTMVGGTGDDTYIVDNAGDTITELVGGGTDSVQSSVAFSLAALAEVENLTLTGSAAINATGNAKDNVLTGNTGANRLDGGAGNDTLNGGAGADTMVGGAGDDTYAVDDAADVVTENLGEGSDTVNSSVTYTLSANVENL
ncbi:MAG TPA: Calx-beta domain-containing protein, partial [Burkholderiaceae bacterium]|nr:Calx-beta domain-containing protein [Burkholderiaceae bacterium]